MGRELPQNLVRRGSRIYVRVEVPPDVRSIVGKAVVFESTGFEDAKLGKAAGLRRLAELETEWAAIRSRREPSGADLHRAVADRYRSELQWDEFRRDSRPTAAELDRMRLDITKSPEAKAALEAASEANRPLVALHYAVDYVVARDADQLDRERRAILLKELQKHVADGETVLVADHVRDLIRRENLAVEPGTRSWVQLCRDLLRAWIASLETIEARDRGDYGATPRDSLVIAALAVPVPPKATSPGETIMGLFDLFASVNPRAPAPRAIQRN